MTYTRLSIGLPNPKPNPKPNLIEKTQPKPNLELGWVATLKTYPNPAYCEVYI